MKENETAHPFEVALLGAQAVAARSQDHPGAIEKLGRLRLGSGTACAGNFGPRQRLSQDFAVEKCQGLPRLRLQFDAVTNLREMFEECFNLFAPQSLRMPHVVEQNVLPIPFDEPADGVGAITSDFQRHAQTIEEFWRLRRFACWDRIGTGLENWNRHGKSPVT